MTTPTLTTPALDALCKRAADLRSVANAVLELARTGRLRALEQDLKSLRKALDGGQMRLPVPGSVPDGMSLAKALAPLAKSLSSKGYPPEQLQAMLRAGTAYRLPGGRIAAVGDVQDLNFWITTAQGASGRGTAEDDAGLRAFLERRAAALGVSQLIPVWGVAKSAADYDRLAQTMTDPVAAEGYRQLAKQARAVVSPAVLRVQAARYEREASVQIDPAMAESYRELARTTRARAESVA